MIRLIKGLNVLIAILLVASFDVHAETMDQENYNSAIKAEKRLFSLKRCAPALGLEKLQNFEDRQLSILLEYAQNLYLKTSRSQNKELSIKSAYRLAVLTKKFHEKFVLNGKSTLRAQSIKVLMPTKEKQKKAIIKNLSLYYKNLNEEIMSLKKVLNITIETLNDELTLSNEIKRNISKIDFINSKIYNDICSLLKASNKIKIIKNVDVISSLNDNNKNIRLSGILKARQKPKAEYKEALIDALYQVSIKQKKRKTFDTLKHAFFGEKEQLLIAIKTLITKNRNLAASVANSAKIPIQERAWLIAELGDLRLIGNYRSFLINKDQIVSARGLYGLYLSVGNKALYLANSYKKDRRPLVRLVANRIIEIEAENENDMDEKSFASFE